MWNFKKWENIWQERMAKEPNILSIIFKYLKKPETQRSYREIANIFIPFKDLAFFQELLEKKPIEKA